MRKFLTFAACIMWATLATAAGSPAWISSLTFQESSPDAVAGVFKDLTGGKGEVTDDGDKVSVKQVKIGKQRYDLSATFKSKGDAKVLHRIYAVTEKVKSAVDYSDRGAHKRYAVLKGLAPTHEVDKGYRLDGLGAVVDEPDKMGAVTITFGDFESLDTEETNHTILMIAGLVAAVLLAMLSLEFWWIWLAGGVLGFFGLGNIAAGLVLGGAAAMTVTAVVMIKRRFFGQSVLYVVHGGSAYGAPGGPAYVHDNDMAINPANGLPMVGGQGGVDVHGNAYGTSMNDHHHV